MKIFFIFLQKTTTNTLLTMSKLAPTPFYNIEANDGMKLRSGRHINHVGTTSLGKDSINLMKVFRVCNDIYDNEGYITGNNWDTDIYYDTEFIKTIHKMAGGKFSTQCTKLYALNRYIRKWRKTINKDIKHDFKNMICKKTQEAINELKKWRANGHERLCGCSDGLRSYDEEVSWGYYESEGPGYLHEDDQQVPTWVQTPEISHEEFEHNFEIEQLSWRHDLVELLNDFEDHLAYFKRVPHHDLQKTYFELSSKIVPSACAINIISFL